MDRANGHLIYHLELPGFTLSIFTKTRPYILSMFEGQLNGRSDKDITAVANRITLKSGAAQTEEDR